MTTSPPSKRIKLESRSPTTPKLYPNEDIVEDEIHCSICLQVINDQTVIPNCSHEFCFECLLIWTKQSRRCPLCAQAIGEYLIHNIRSKYDFSKHYLAPLRTSPAPQVPLHATSSVPTTRVERRRTARDRERERREREELDEVDKLERSIMKRRWIYQHHLYAKHVASNAFTRYKPYPSPAQFSASQDLISRTTSFVRRELQVWPNLDVEFLTTFTISIMKSIDIRSESAVKLLTEFLDIDEPYVEGRRHINAEHFAHEIYSFVRSPYRDLFIYDDAVQYDIPTDIPPLPHFRESRRRWRRSRSLSRPPSSRSRSHSPVLRSISPREDPHSRSERDSRNPSSHTRSPSDASIHVCESDKRPESARPSSSRQETKKSSQSKWRQPDPGSSLSGRCRNPSDDGDGSPRSVPGQTSERSRMVDLGARQRSEDARSSDTSHLRDQRFMKFHKAPIHPKGKLKEDDTKQISSINIYHDNAAESHSLPTQPRIATYKPPRNRSLRESVEAYLGGGRRMIPAAGNDMNAERKDSQSHAENNLLLLPDNTPQLIMSGREPRNSMSGTIAATEFENSLYSSETSYSPLSRQSSQQHSSAHDRREDLNKSVNGECSGNSHVFPSSLSRLGPRVLAKDSTVTPLATSSRGDSGGEADTGTAWPTSDNNLTQIEPSGISHSQFAESDLRSRLLSRLQEGKEHACNSWFHKHF
ncbi:hypothetical protein F5887DRAFT_968262 [Amanita rubescens]|nr:hypothetical protein F5887DRAFT_968262 [Amanita rubescens]